MTAALVKKCSICQEPFLRESGCNKIICSCGYSHCYVCSAKVEGYHHFGNGAGQCPLYDDIEEPERQEVAVAQGQDVLDGLATPNDVTGNDLTVDQKPHSPDSGAEKIMWEERPEATDTTGEETSAGKAGEEEGGGSNSSSN
jgi:hypothetical protein